MVAPLKGVRVVELARILAGPWIGQTLADLGAEVIKIESPDGDDTRQWGPPFVAQSSAHDNKPTAAYFYSTNRGKKSMVIDFKSADDLNRLKALIANADILVENFKVGGLQKYGLDYETLAKQHPALIYCSITGFGQTGPYAHRAGYDYLIQAMSGIMDLTGDPQGEPQKIGVAFADIFTGLYGVIGIQAALHARHKTQQGQHIDLSLQECMTGVLANQAMNYLITGETPKRLGNAHPNIVPYQVFEVQDSYIVIACGNDRQFRALASCLDMDSLAEDSKFKTNPLRVENRDALLEIISPLLKTYSMEEILQKLEIAGVPAGPINSVEDALNDPQILHRGLRIEPEGLPGLRTPIRFSESSLNLEKTAPQLGQHDNLDGF